MTHFRLYKFKANSNTVLDVIDDVLIWVLDRRPRTHWPRRHSWSWGRIQMLSPSGDLLIRLRTS